MMESEKGEPLFVHFQSLLLKKRQIWQLVAAAAAKVGFKGSVGGGGSGGGDCSVGKVLTASVEYRSHCRVVSSFSL